MRTCPGCAAPMQVRTFERKPLGMVELDLCFPCRAIWFDAMESAQLTPGAVIALFREIHAHEQDVQQPSGSRMQCPTCRKKLQHVKDMIRGQHLFYERCPEGHGRFTTFLQFLREKQFVRELTVGEIEQLRATVKQVRCSSCGANVDITHDTHCAYCHSAIAVLDADAVDKALRQLAQGERQRLTQSPTAAIDAMLASQRFEHKLARIEGRPAEPAIAAAAMAPAIFDLLSVALSALLD